jgi:hypothetical protein
MAAYEFLYQEDIYQITDTILVLIDRPWEELREEDKTLLSKIMGAVKVSLDRTQVLNMPSTDLSTLSICNPAKVISFGVSLAEGNELYKCLNKEKTTFILSDSLALLDDARKKSLWGALKQMFP